MKEEQQRTVLFVSPGPDLSIPSSGEGARLKNLSQELSADWRVYALVPETTETELPWVDTVFTYEQWSLPFLTDLNPSFVRNLNRVLSEYNPDVVHTSKGVCSSKILSRLVSRSSAVVYASQNVEAVHANDFVDDDLPIYKRLLGPKLIPLIERMSVVCADHVTTVSEKDASTFRERYNLGEEEVTTVPTGTQTIDHEKIESTEAVLKRFGVDGSTVAVFHGTGSHPPNYEAAQLIDREIAPALLDRGVDVHFLIAGSDMPEPNAPNVTSLGFVEDLDSLLHAVDLAVVPIRHGGGTKTKIYDYLSHGLPIVSTEKGVEGIDVEDRKEALIIDEVDETFVSAVEELGAHPQKRESVRRAVNEFAAEHDWEISVARLEKSYQVLRS